MRERVGRGADMPATERAERRPSVNSFLTLQASAGNAAVSRLVDQSGSSLMAPELFVQREPKATTAQTPLVPGLGRARQDMLEEMIQQQDYQGALDTLIGFKYMDYEIKTKLLANGTMRYGNFRYDGETASPKWDQAGNLLPAVVEIGPTAFRSLPYLYMVVMHEYQHVLDHQTAAGRQKREDGEVEARAWDIMHAVELGISKSPDIVADEWNELNTEYAKIADQQALARVRPVATQAYAAAKKLVAGKAKLDPFLP